MSPRARRAVHVFKQSIRSKHDLEGSRERASRDGKHSVIRQKKRRNLRTTLQLSFHPMVIYCLKLLEPVYGILATHYLNVELAVILVAPYWGMAEKREVKHHQMQHLRKQLQLVRARQANPDHSEPEKSILGLSDTMAMAPRLSCSASVHVMALVLIAWLLVVGCPELTLKHQWIYHNPYEWCSGASAPIRDSSSSTSSNSCSPHLLPNTLAFSLTWQPPPPPPLSLCLSFPPLSHSLLSDI